MLWNPIAQRTDPKGLLPQTPVLKELAALRYSDGLPVLQDRNLAGAAIMREILAELGQMDDVAFQELGYGKWTEHNQRSTNNDSYIYQGVMGEEFAAACSKGESRAKFVGSVLDSHRTVAERPDQAMTTIAVARSLGLVARGQDQHNEPFDALRDAEAAGTLLPLVAGASR
ncbi:MAG: hypothetical protein GX575_10810 [Candidatus Anammoximicrobium sp.]|nr:hypothetical protein [Candidatus Anammoximicrobium sp.]